MYKIKITQLKASLMFSKRYTQTLLLLYGSSIDGITFISNQNVN